MNVDYAPFVNNVLIPKYEGGYTWDKGDPGGPTNYGITCYDLAQEEGKTMNSMAAWAGPVKAMPLSVADKIYQTKYASAIMFDNLPAGVDCCMMDYGVNSGVSRPINVARAIVGVKGAAKMDATLLTAIQKYDPTKFINAMCDERLQFMHAIKGGAMWAEFGRGWGSRVANLRSYCAHLAAGGVHQTAPIAPDLSKTPTPKVTNTTTASTTSRSTSAVSVVAAGGAAHLAGYHWGVVIGVVIVVALIGIGYEWYQHNKAATANATVHA